MARLLAYGGTSFTWRCRIGSWSELAPGYLQSKTGLYGGRLSVGFLPPPLGPALALREIQSPESRGGYAYTLLLDPGEEAWERLGWNAAALASAIASDETLRTALLAEPDPLSAARLDALVEGLRPAPPVPAADPRFGELLAGASLASGGGEVTPLAPTAAGLGDPLELAALAAALEAQPRCFRAGCGWLSHGSADVAAHLGATLLLDPDAAADPARLALFLETGRATLEAFRRLGDDPAVTEAARVPAWRWSEAFGEPAATRALALRRLAAFRAGGAQPDAAYAELAELATSLAPRLAEAALGSASRGGGPLGPAATRFLLSRRVPLDESLAGRLDTDAAVDTCLATGQAPDAALPVALRLRIWRGKCDAARPEELPALVLEAAWDLQGPELQRLLAHAFDAWGRDGLRPLAEWESVLTASPTLTALAAELLRREVLRRLREAERPPGWVDDYLAFGCDPGGEAAASRLTPAAARELVAAVLAEGSDRARAWLAALHLSPLRDLLDWKTEVNAAYTLGGDWRPVTEVDRLMLGDTEPPSGKPVPREAWLDALRRALRSWTSGAGVPALGTLVGFLGSLPKDIADRLEALQPELTWESSERWLEGWRRLGPAAREEGEFQRLVATADPPPLQTLDERRRDRLVTWLLVALRPNAAPPRAARAAELLPRLAAGEDERRLVDAAVARHIPEAARIDLIAPGAAALLACLSRPTALAVLEKRLRAGRAPFVTDLARLRATGQMPAPILEAVRTLVSRDGKLRRELESRRFETWWEASFLERLAARFRARGPRMVRRR